MKILYLFKLPKSFYFIFFILFFSITAFSQTDDSLYYTNPDYHVAKELFNRRIVMLGETGHHQPGNYKYLLNSLENWLILCNKDTTINLTLVLERDENDGDDINKYIRNGDITSYFEKFTPEYYLEDIDFLTNLRKFYQKVDSLNINMQHKLNFTVKGFEDVGDKNLEKVTKMTNREHNIGYVNELDSTTAMGIVNYMKKNPLEQILIFYGSNHLVDGYQNKNLGYMDLTESESMGYYLPYFLRDKFGKSNVLTIYTDPYIENYISNPAIVKVKNKNIIFKSDDIGNNDVKYAKYVDQIYFYHTCWIESPIYEKFICSRFTFEKEVKELNRIKKWFPYEKARRFYLEYLFIIPYVSGITTKDTNDILDKLKNSNIDATDWLYSNKLRDSLLIPNFDKNHRKSFVQMILSSYGFKNNFYYADTTPVENYEKWKRDEFPKIYDQIKFTNSIGIFWFGYPNEKITAKEYLVQFSGEDFQEPEKYLNWYWKKYFGCEY